MIVTLLAAMLAAPAAGDDCVHAGVPATTRESLAAAWLAKEKVADAEAAILVNAVFAQLILMLRVTAAAEIERRKL